MTSIKRFTAIVMALLFCICSVPFSLAEGPGPAFFEDEEGEDSGSRLNYIHDEYLTRSSSVSGRIDFTTGFRTDPEIMMKIGFTKLTIQHWTGTEWEDIWSVTKQYDHYTDSFQYSGYLTGCTSGQMYRATCTLYAMKGVFYVQKMSLTTLSVVCS